MNNLSTRARGPEPVARDAVETVETDVVFDLMHELCNVLYEDGFSRTSSKLEAALDVFLVETGKVDPRDRSGPKRRNPPEVRHRQRTSASASKAADRQFSKKNLVSFSAYTAEGEGEIDNIFSDLDQDNTREAKVYQKRALRSA